MTDSSFLVTILDQKKKEIATLYDEKGLDYFQTLALQTSSPNYQLSQALAGPGLQLIAEIKKASPSKGVICQDFDPLTLAKTFCHQGASALSVLTDAHFFQGDLSFITQIQQHVSLPLIRKDFLIDPIQIYQAKIAGASAILLIKACLDVSTLQRLLLLANQLGLDVIVEIHHEDDLMAIQSLTGQFCMVIYKRDLTSCHFYTSIVMKLFSQVKTCFKDHLVIAESGYHTLEDMKTLEKIGVDAVLIGEGLMKNNELLTFFYERRNMRINQ